METKAVIIGAGALGLGFLAERMAADYELTLVDTAVQAASLEHLQRHQGYTVNICAPDGVTTTTISGVFQTVVSDASGGRDQLAQALLQADLVLTATGRKFLDGIVADIAGMLNKRQQKTWLLFCENGRDIAAYYRKDFQPQIVLVDTVMSRMCRFADATQEKQFPPLWPGSDTALVVEQYSNLPVDGNLCRPGPFSSAFSMVSREEFLCWEDVKFYLHNGVHAFVSYHAFLEGARFYPQTSASIRQKAREVVMEEVVPAIVKTHAVADREEIERYGLELLDRFFNPFFNDSIARGVRGAAQKLSPDERLVSGCEFIKKAGLDPRGYASTIDAARKVMQMQG